MSKRMYRVLIADDCAEDRLLLKTAMRRAQRLKIIGEASDGEETVAFLKRHFPSKSDDGSPFPDLLLLDLKMPLMDGFEVLDWLRAKNYDGLTTIVLTDSVKPEHIKRALDSGADFFQVKPRTNHDREIMVLAIEEFLAGNMPQTRLLQKRAAAPRLKHSAATIPAY